MRGRCDRPRLSLIFSAKLQNFYYMQNIEQEINRIVEIFGMKASVIAQAMGITQQTYYSKKDPKNDRHQFNQKNLDDLKKYLKEQIQKL